MTVVDRFIQATSHGGAQRPTLIVVHSAETPLRAGYAYSIAANWFGSGRASTSAHFMVDPSECIRMLSDNVVAYHVGPAANGFTLGIEQAGYARLSRAEWTTDAGMDQLRTVGALIAECCDRWGIPKRWASDAQIRAARYGTPAGVCFHDDIRRVLGGTVHYDPMPNYPRDLLERAWNNPGEDDMPSKDEFISWVREATRVPESKLGIGPADLSTTTARVVDEAFQARTDAAEARRMLGVMLGWRAPATPAEKAALEQLRGSAVDVDEQAVAAAFVDAARPMLLEAVQAGMAADNQEQADAIVDRLAQRLGSA